MISESVHALYMNGSTRRTHAFAHERSVKRKLLHKMLCNAEASLQQNKKKGVPLKLNRITAAPVGC